MKMYVLRENCLGIHLDGGIDICIEWKISRLSSRKDYQRRNFGI